METENKPKTRLNFIGFIVLAIIIGFLAGISGEFFTRYYLSNLAFFRELYFTEQADVGQREIIIRDPRKVVVEQDLRLDQLKKEIQSSVVGIYEKKAGKTLLDKIFLPQDYLGQAIVLTSDGWLISTDKSVSGAKENLVVSYNKKIYEIEKIVEDNLSSLVFIKIEAQNLPVVKLANFDAITDGQQVFVYNSYLNQLNLANIQDKRYKDIGDKYDLISSSEILDKRILLNQTFNNQFKASPVVNFQGEIIGLLAGQGEINKAIPIHYIDPIISQILKEEEIKRSYLGVNYLNLSQIYGLSKEDRQGLKNGALIWPDQSGKAILSDSPLVDQLEAGDIITEIEDQKIDQDKDLLDLLLEYKSGQEILIKYVHEGEEAELSVFLE